MTRKSDVAMVRCNHTSRTWHLVCRGTAWMGDIGNCSTGEKPYQKARHDRRTSDLQVLIPFRPAFCLPEGSKYIYHNRSSDCFAAAESRRKSVRLIPQEGHKQQASVWSGLHVNFIDYDRVGWQGWVALPTTWCWLLAKRMTNLPPFPFDCRSWR